jgi:hypothetical protein
MTLTSSLHVGTTFPKASINEIENTLTNPAVAMEMCESKDCNFETAQHVRAGNTDTKDELEATALNIKDGRTRHSVALK